GLDVRHREREAHLALAVVQRDEGGAGAVGVAGAGDLVLPVEPRGERAPAAVEDGRQRGGRFRGEGAGGGVGPDELLVAPGDEGEGEREGEEEGQTLHDG